jgi:uncharacterized protein with HEPN domain
MIDAATEAIRSAKGKTCGDLEKNPVWALGLVKCVEIIGEAAARISDDTRQSHPEIRWLEIVAMRNRLVHAYFDIDLDQVWKAVTEDLPPLVGQLERILASESTSSRGAKD